MPYDERPAESPTAERLSRAPYRAIHLAVRHREDVVQRQLVAQRIETGGKRVTMRRRCPSRCERPCAHVQACARASPSACARLSRYLGKFRPAIWCATSYCAGISLHVRGYSDRSKPGSSLKKMCSGIGVWK